MPLVDFTDMMDNVLAEVRLAPEELAIQKMREIARDFCQQTRAWVADGPPQTIAIGTSTYTIVPPGDSEPVNIESVSVNEVPANPKTPEWFDTYFPTWKTRDSDDFSYYTQLTRKTFCFPGKPTVAGTTDGLTYSMSLKPGPSSIEIDEDVWSEYYEAITIGAKAELLVMDGERWSNVKRGVDYRQQYAERRSQAGIKILRGYANADFSWVSPYKFGGR